MFIPTPLASSTLQVLIDGARKVMAKANSDAKTLSEDGWWVGCAWLITSDSH